MSDATLIALIVSLEAKRYEATIQRDIATLEHLLDERLMYTHSSGRVETKQALLESIRRGNPRYEAIERDDVVVHIHHDVVAVVTGGARFTVTANGDRKVSYTRFTNVWTSSETEPDRWRLSAWQATRV